MIRRQPTSTIQNGELHIVSALYLRNGMKYQWNSNCYTHIFVVRIHNETIQCKVPYERKWKIQDVGILPKVDMEKPTSPLPYTDSVEIPTTHVFGVRLHSGITQSSARCERKWKIQDGGILPDVDRNKTYISASIHDSKEMSAAIAKFSRSGFSMDYIGLRCLD